MVHKVGQEDFWEQWATGAAHIAQGCLDRLSRLIARPGSHEQAFEEFLAGLRKTVNPAVEPGQALEMLAQHLITRPAFEALSRNYSFASHNPVSRALQKTAGLLEAVEKDILAPARFYEAVKTRLSDLDLAGAGEETIIEFYENLFNTAFTKTVGKPGFVPTPPEVVDYLNRSTAAVLEKDFGRSLADENVHILDPFAGPGTFITRLIQSGLIPSADLARKYDREIQANEIALLPYYIASLNIENAYHAVLGEKSAYKPFNGLCLADTFQLGETAKSLLAIPPPPNSGRAQARPQAPLLVIIGSPPYSEGRRPANGLARSHPKLEKRLAGTYAAAARAANKNPLYNTCLKAFRWSTDRLDGQRGGLIAFVSNGGWLESQALDGFRKCLEREFSSIYVLHLRGDQRASRGSARREGGCFFAPGRRAPVAITVLVKKPEHKGKAAIHHHDLGERLTGEEKLAQIAGLRHALNPDIEWNRLKPDRHGDWLNQGNDRFAGFIPLGDKGGQDNRPTVFGPCYSRGLKTNRDAWCYNFSRNALQDNLKNHLAFYNRQVAEKSIFPGLYRPFQKTWVYFNREINSRVYQLPKLFPTPEHGNLVICVAADKNEPPLMADRLPDARFNGASQCFPLFHYELPKNQTNLFDSEEKPGLRRTGITEYIIKQAQNLYGLKANKEDIFYYVYGLLHSRDYRQAFAAELKKTLPRLPLAGNFAAFSAFSQAGRALAGLHLGYEDQPAPPEVKVTGEEADEFRVEKMRFFDKADKSAIEYNHWIKITGIPLEAYEYVVNGRPAVEWVMARYQVKTDRASGLVNDPNDWAGEHGNPRYILDLLLSVMTVSLETMKIVRGLPKLEFQP